MIKNPKLAAFAPRPRVALVEKMCERCPFKPDGSGYAVDHPEFPQICEMVDLTGSFYCHETVLFDARTKKNKAGDPKPDFQEHFRQCQGAWNRYLEKWEERTAKALAAREAEQAKTGK